MKFNRVGLFLIGACWYVVGHIYHNPEVIGAGLVLIGMSICLDKD